MITFGKHAIHKMIPEVNITLHPAGIGIVCGAFLKTLSSIVTLADTTSSIYALMLIMASQNRSSSALLSLSVGSIIKVPATGNETVGA